MKRKRGRNDDVEEDLWVIARRRNRKKVITGAILWSLSMLTLLFTLAFFTIWLRTTPEHEGTLITTMNVIIGMPIVFTWMLGLVKITQKWW